MLGFDAFGEAPIASHGYAVTYNAKSVAGSSSKAGNALGRVVRKPLKAGATWVGSHRVALARVFRVPHSVGGAMVKALPFTFAAASAKMGSLSRHPGKNLSAASAKAANLACRLGILLKATVAKAGILRRNDAITLVAHFTAQAVLRKQLAATLIAVAIFKGFRSRIVRHFADWQKTPDATGTWNKQSTGAQIWTPEPDASSTWEQDY